MFGKRKYVYRVLDMPRMEGTPMGYPDYDRLLEQLNSLAEKGWECVGQIQFTDRSWEGMTSGFLLKRLGGFV